jgi:histidyl-tRNA synthetase
MNDKSKKPQKLKARLPRGLEDRGPAEIAATRRMTDEIRKVYELYGFEPVETPAIEYTDALGKFLPDQDRPNEGVFSFQDDDEQWLSLRYDLTAPLARYVADKIGKEDFVLPYRSYRFGWVFRNEKPGPGRFRQFMQFDADTVGSGSPAADAEMCMMAADTMEALGVARGQYVVKVNNRKVLDGVMELVGLGGDENAGKRLTVLRAIDKLDRLGVEGVRQLLGEGRKDESGDYTKGAGLDQKQIETLEKLYGHQATRSQDFFLARTKADAASADDSTLVGPGGDRYVVADPRFLETYAKVFSGSELAQAGIGELQEISNIVRGAGYGTSRVKIDVSVVRGLEYYTGPVYEVELLLETKDEKGRPVRFGSVGGGGRYDGLVSRCRGEPVPATGFSIGVSRLQAALTLIGKLDKQKEPGPVVVTVLGGDIAQYQKMVAELRKANIRAELYLGNPKHSIGQQLKYADKRNSPCAIIQGSNEKDEGKVIVRDLIAGIELAKLEKGRDDYLAKQAEAQTSVPESKLVDGVKAILAKHKINWN